MKSTTRTGLLRPCGALLMMSILAAPAVARVGAPVLFSLGSGDAIQPGQPMTVHVILQPAADIQQAQFGLRSSADWQIAGGTSYWLGSLSKGQAVEFQFQAIPLRSDPEALQAVLSIPGFDERTAILDPNRTGGRTPEKAVVFRDRSQPRAAVEQEPVETEFEPGAFVPEPLGASEPRRLGQPEQIQPVNPQLVNPKGAKIRGARVTFTATGRFTYNDNNGFARRVRFATVEVLNLNPFGDELCGRATTDGNGNFSFTATCGDFFDDPDLVARIVLNNSVIEVKPDSVFAGSYTFQSPMIANSTSTGTVAFGTINITVNQAAFAVHNLATRAQRFIADQGETMSKVTVFFPIPDNGAFYVPGVATLHIPQDRAFGEVGTVFHEYTHHILDTKAESPGPDYSNGNCDTPNPGHCFGQPEKGVVAWTEGFPDYYAALLHGLYQASDGYPTSTKYASEDSIDPTEFAFPGEEDHTEGIISSILFDLSDAAPDDNNPNVAGSDRISLPFSAIWQVVRTFDPSGDVFHNHPTSIHEFYSGLRSQRLNDINKVSEVYGQYNIAKPLPDLEVSSLQNPPQALAPGLQFNVNNTVVNTGNELANSASTVRYELRRVVTRGQLVPPAILVGSRTVGSNLGAGSQSSAQTSLQVPAGAALGTYTLRACVDSGSAVPESDEANNCRTAATTTVIR